MSASQWYDGYESSSCVLRQMNGLMAYLRAATLSPFANSEKRGYYLICVLSSCLLERFVDGVELLGLLRQL